MKTKISLFLTALSLCLLTMVSVVQAEKMEYKDSSYNFKNIKNVMLYDMDFDRAAINSSIVENSLNDIYQRRAVKENLPVIDSETVMRKMSLDLGQDMDLLMDANYEEFMSTFEEHLPDYVDAYITADVLEYTTKEVYHPEYTSWETRTEHHTIKDKDGKTITISEQVLVPVHHPAYYETVFYEDVEFHVYDSKTGKEIYSRKDWRDRSDNDGSSMFERICNSFFKDFRKLIK